MTGSSAGPFTRTAAGFRAVLGEPEADLLAALVRDLRDRITDGPADGPGTGETRDEVWERLFPRAYLDPTEEAAERDWQDAVHPDLRAGRLAALDRVLADLAGAPRARGRVECVLDGAAAEAWLAVLNDLRLAIGTTIGVTDDFDPDPAGLDPADPAHFPAAVYHLLTWYEGALVEVLLGGA